VGLTGRVAIRVEESRLSLLWQAPGGAWAVDELGVAQVPPADVSGLVPVRDEAGVLARPGDQLRSELVAAAVAFAARFGELSYRPETGFSARTREGWELRLGSDAERAPRQMALLESVRAELAGKADQVAFVDLSIVNRPYYRLRGGSE
jgi:hypothetical protein